MKKIIKALAFSSVFISSIAFAEVSVIVNAANNAAADTSFIKKVYLGKAKSFSGGEKVKVFTLNDQAGITEEFRAKALKKSNSQYKSYWSKLVFTGKGTPPKEMASEEEMIEMVAKTPNAIGFVSSSKVNDKVKVIATY